MVVGATVAGLLERMSFYIPQGCRSGLRVQGGVEVWYEETALCDTEIECGVRLEVVVESAVKLGAYPMVSPSTVSVSPNGSYCAVLKGDGPEVAVFCTTSATKLYSSFTPDLSFSPCSRFFLGTKRGVGVTVNAAQTGNVIDTFNLTERTNLAWSPDSASFACIYDAGLEIISIRDKSIAKVDGYQGMGVSCVLCTASVVITAAYDGCFRVNCVNNLRCLNVVQAHPKYIISMALSRDGKELLTGGGSNDCTVKSWSLSTYTCLRIFAGHTRSIWKIDTSAHHVAAMGYCGRILVWGAEGGEEEGRVVHDGKGAANGLSGFALSPCGQRLFRSEPRQVVVSEVCF